MKILAKETAVLVPIAVPSVWRKSFPLNGPFPSSKKSYFQNESKCETFVVKMSFICMRIKTHFHINSFALSLALKVRFFGTRKWPIGRSFLVSLSISLKYRVGIGGVAV